MVLHEVGEAQSSRAAHTSGTVQQRAALLHLHGMDMVGNGVEEIAETGDGCIDHGHLYVLDILIEGVCNLYRDVDDRGDVIAGQQQLVVGGRAIADE